MNRQWHEFNKVGVLVLHLFSWHGEGLAFLEKQLGHVLDSAGNH